MSDLLIYLDYITGRSVAADVSDRDEPEWPPHPGRAFMALAAACFERGEDEAEVAALRWLESLGAPQIVASPHEKRSSAKYYVPINDKLAASKSLLQSTPGLARSKQERRYPTAVPECPVVKFVWRDVSGIADHQDALSSISANVIRVGHSSSLVRCWIQVTDSSQTIPHESAHIVWQPVDRKSQWRARVAGGGEFDRLRSACNAAAIDQFGDLTTIIESTKGAQQKEARREFETAFGRPYKSALRPPEPTPPVLGLWQGYGRAEADDRREAIESSYFNSELLILAKLEGRTVGIQDCLALTSRLRDAAMSHCTVQPPPAWLGGHDAEGKPASEPHTAFLALPFVGREYADGHVMGLALALPKAVSPQERGRLLGPLFVDANGNVKDVELKLGHLGVWTLRLEERGAPPRSLQNQTWTRPSETWASVTPVVLDRFPKSSRAEDRRAWEAEVRSIVAQSCVRAGLLSPVEIDLDTTSWHVGSPRAYGKSRPLRGPNGSEATAPLGDGFPAMPSRAGKPTRPQIHVYLKFDRPVRGPVLLGAGRFLGYGLCRPTIQ